jgi:hypothetical protein
MNYIGIKQFFSHNSNNFQSVFGVFGAVLKKAQEMHLVSR